MLTISIPDEIDKQLSSITTDKKKFILSAIRQKIMSHRKSVTPENLPIEYADSVKENKEITDDFSQADKENRND